MVGWKIKIHKGEEMNWKEELKKELTKSGALHKDAWDLPMIEADGNGFLNFIESFIESLLKKQRIICAKELFKETSRYNGDMISEMTIIRNAPEPEDL